MHDALLTAQLDPRRTIASIFLHPACDLACAFCGADAHFDTMSPGQVRALVAALARRGFESVVFGGGEPLRWPHDLDGAIHAAHAQGLLVQISTHGAHLDDALLRDARVGRFLLPLESRNARTHDDLRGPSHQAKVLRTIEACFAAGREVTLTTVLCRSNLSGAEALAARIEDWRRAGAPLHGWHVYRFAATGRNGARRAGTLSIDVRTFRRAVSAMRSAAPGLTIYRRDDFLRASRVEYFWYEGGSLRVGSLHPRPVYS